MPPNSVVKIVESAIRMWPARVARGGIQRKELNSRLPASVNGCGRARSIGWRASTCTAFGVVGRHRIVRQVQVEVEGRDAVEQAQRVQVPVDGQRARSAACPAPTAGRRPN